MPIMTLIEAIQNRHSVRRYRPDPIDETALARLKEAIAQANRQASLHIQLITNEPKAFSGPMAYGKFEGVNNYLVMAGKREKDLDERIGYYGEGLVLLAQQLGLNSCWAGLSYRKISGTYALDEDEKIACYIALGYGQSQGSPHKGKSAGEVSNAGASTPDWFQRGVDAALLAPTAINQQKFFIEYLGADEGELPKVSIRVKGIPFADGYGDSEAALRDRRRLAEFSVGAEKMKRMWLIFAILSAVFAAATAVLAKIGIDGVDSNLATAIRTVVVVIMAWAVVIVAHRIGHPGQSLGAMISSISSRSWLFIILSGIATGASWLCYFYAIKNGDVSKVVPIDKCSLVLTIIFAVIFLGESFTWKTILGCLLLLAGSIIMIL